MQVGQAKKPQNPRIVAMNAMTESDTFYRASGEVEFIANCVLYSFCRVMGIKADGDAASGWNRDRWHEQMAPFAAVLAAMITITAERHDNYRREEDAQ